ncbi:sterol uptake control protein 2 [Rhypophila sp. PSN 637]
MEANQFAGFANTFLVENGSERPSIQTVGPDQDISRRKRPHRCDEEYPCGNCTKRNETCVRHRPPRPAGQGNRQQQQQGQQGQSPSPSIPSRPPSVAPASQPAADGSINLLHMELLHHFERFTIPTLCFQEIWPTMLQLAFHSQQHTYLVNAVLSLAAAHKSYLSPNQPRYHRANYSLLDRSLREYRKALSSPITSTNCDALLGTAILIHHLMWCDLSFMDVNQPGEEGLDLSADRLYWLSTGVRQIFFMAWPLFQTNHSVFMRVPVLQPCMALEDEVDARGLVSWQRIAQGFMDLYDNPRYKGGRGAFSPAYTPESSRRTVSQSPGISSPTTTTTQSMVFDNNNSSSSLPEALSLGSQGGILSKVRTLWDSYKSGEAFVQQNQGGQQQDEANQRAAYERLVVRLAVAIAFIQERGTSSSGTTCPAGAFACQFASPPDSARTTPLTKADIVRYVLTFPMLCFGPFLPLISTGDSRALVVLLHIYRVVRVLLPTDDYWWCRRRAEVMERVIGDELRARGLEICIRRRDEVC